jgi:hypothetical protein
MSEEKGDEKEGASVGPGAIPSAPMPEHEDSHPPPVVDKRQMGLFGVGGGEGQSGK